MPDEINDKINIDDVLNRLYNLTQRHLANMDNSLAMMRNGHFIEAYQRLLGTKDGISHMKILVDKTIELTRKISDEKNSH